MGVVTIEQARRLLMWRQGLLDDPTRPADAGVVYELIKRMGFVQIDTITTVERAHQHILHTRLDGYEARMLEKLHHDDRMVFEHMTHDASVIPSEWYGHWKPRFARYRQSFEMKTGATWIRSRLGRDGAKEIERVLAHVREAGPSMSRDVPMASTKKGTAGWWEWKPHKAALEYLWRIGELAVARRENFNKVYDLAERVLPDQHRAEAPDDADHVQWACESALHRLGVATPKEIAAFWQTIPIKDAAAWTQRALREGRVVPAPIKGDPGSHAAVAFPGIEREIEKTPPAPDRMRLLSPFDPVIRDRARLERWFGFEYRFEAFTPEAKRQYGYYVMPVLEGDRMVGRVDPKVYRDEGVLRIRKVWWESGERVTRARERRLEEAAERLARFAGVDRVEIAWERPRAKRGAR